MPRHEMTGGETRHLHCARGRLGAYSTPPGRASPALTVGREYKFLTVPYHQVQMSGFSPSYRLTSEPDLHFNTGDHDFIW